jgi:hypothetical protein
MLARQIPLVFLLLMFLILIPVHASLAQIAAGAPVFIGEQNLDISLCLNGHSVIAWWPAGADLSSDPAKTVTVSGNGRSFYLDPAVFSGYTGTWYTHDAKPDIPVFVVYQPQINLSIWNTDTNTDITGQSVPMSTNITYRIDTNLYTALNYTLRPNYNLADGFFAVTLTSPSGMNIPQIFTGNVGDPTTRIMPFNNAPIIRSSPYIWQDGPAWDRNAINTDGSRVYPTGTYTFVASQNLNGMSSSYSDATAIGNVTSGDKTVTFIADAVTSSPTVLPSGTAPAGSVTTTTGTTSPAQQATGQPTATIIPKKTTFSPLPPEIIFLGIGIAALVTVIRRKY